MTAPTIARLSTPVAATPIDVPRPTRIPTVHQSPIRAPSVAPGLHLAAPWAYLRVLQDGALPLLVFFSSSRSGPARRMESLVAHIARKERDRLRVLQVDVDQRADLVEKLSVNDVPTLVLVVGRTAVARLDGRASAPRIEAMLADHLREPLPAA
ncbi:MAG: thioredoxin family protein [Gaiellaceae bacterium]